MPVVLVTGAAGLIGSEAAQFYCRRGYRVIGIDNDMRSQFFGPAASTRGRQRLLQRDYACYSHCDLDIRERSQVEQIFAEYGRDIVLVVHAAAQPSHDWAARHPHLDFEINANGTLVLLEAARQFCPDSVFIFTSTNKVYGDRPNRLPLVETDTRWDVDREHPYWVGIDESMSVDATKHSLFGVSKTAGDLLVQEYGKYFSMKTACFRAGCVTGPHHAGTEMHGFLSYLTRCVATGSPYIVFGHKGKQVRDNIHSRDYVAAIDQFFSAPRVGEVYNLGGGRARSCSILEAISLCEEIAGKQLDWRYTDTHRSGDHAWWISSNAKFVEHFPGWAQTYDLRSTLQEMFGHHIEHER
jgi:CDP-paratose 2-epimerase